jgi:hypothetical protein
MKIKQASPAFNRHSAIATFVFPLSDFAFSLPYFRLGFWALDPESLRKQKLKS